MFSAHRYLLGSIVPIEPISTLVAALVGRLALFIFRALSRFARQDAGRCFGGRSWFERHSVSLVITKELCSFERLRSVLLSYSRVTVRSPLAIHRPLPAVDAGLLAVPRPATAVLAELTLAGVKWRIRGHGSANTNLPPLPIRHSSPRVLTLNETRLPNCPLLVRRPLRFTDLG